MNLSGTLSDLTLTELLGMLSLARKSGLLEVYSEDNIAWIGLNHGAVIGFSQDAGGPERKQLLMEAGLEDDEADERVARCLAESVAGAILALEDWEEGEFSLDAAAHLGDRGPEAIALARPLSVCDLCSPSDPPGGVPARQEGASDRPSDPRSSSCCAPGPSMARQPLLAFSIVILVDSDLVFLEKLKAALSSRIGHVHVFQDAKSALGRLKQYLAGGVFPGFVVGQSGRGGQEIGRRSEEAVLLERVRSLSARVPLVVLGDQAAREWRSPTACLPRPDPAQMTSATWTSFVEDVLKLLAESA